MVNAEVSLQCLKKGTRADDGCPVYAMNLECKAKDVLLTSFRASHLPEGDPSTSCKFENRLCLCSYNVIHSRRDTMGESGSDNVHPHHLSYRDYCVCSVSDLPVSRLLFTDVMLALVCVMTSSIHESMQPGSCHWQGHMSCQLSSSPGFRNVTRLTDPIFSNS
jgi:hypothetical protein